MMSNANTPLMAGKMLTAGGGKRDMVRNLIPVATLVILIIVSAMLSPSFLTVGNLTNLMRQHALRAIVAMGMLMVILTGGIELSVGSLVALSGVLTAYFCQTNESLVAVFFTALIMAGIGLCAGYLVSYRRLAPFVVTLAVMSITRGVAYIVSKGTPIRLPERAWLLRFGVATTFGIPQPAVLALIIFLLIMAVLRYTGFGRLVKAIGSNESAVRLSGIRVELYKMAVYVVCAVLCAFGGMISASRAGVGSPMVWEGLELDAIAAVVIGGASLTGGQGSALNTLMGVLILALIGNIMNLMNIASYPQQVIKGVIIILAVLLQSGFDEKR